MFRKRESKTKDSSVSAASVPEPPDSGWAWVVLFASFATLMFFGGFLGSLSVYVYIWMDYFDAGATETSLIITICSFMIGLLSPIADAFCRRFGPRLGTMFGGLVMCAGVVASSQANGILFLIASLGIVAAFGISMCTNAALMVIGMYFKKYLGLAMGLSTSGASVGQLIFPPLYQFLIDNYGWRGSIIIIAGITFHILASASLLRPLATKKPKKQTPQTQNEVSKAEGNDTNANSGQQPRPELRNPEFLNPSFLDTENLQLPEIGVCLEDGSIFQSDLAMEMMKDEDRIEYVVSDSSLECNEAPTMINSAWASFGINSVERYRRRSSRLEKFIPRPSDRSSSIIVSQTPAKPRSKFCHLIRNPSLLLVLLVSLINGFVWASTTYHMVSRAKSVNIKADDAALLVTALGAGSLVGRLSMGWFMDKNIIGFELCYCLACTVYVLANFVMPFFTTFGPLMGMSVVLGITVGSSTVIVITAPRYVVKPSVTTMATAYMLLFWGSGEISGGAFAGWIYDTYESYNYSFYSACVVLTTGIALMLVIYCLQRARRRRHENETKPKDEKPRPSKTHPTQVDKKQTESEIADLAKSAFECVEESMCSCHENENENFESGSEKLSPSKAVLEKKSLGKKSQQNVESSEIKNPPHDENLDINTNSSTSRPNFVQVLTEVDIHKEKVYESDEVNTDE